MLPKAEIWRLLASKAGVPNPWAVDWYRFVAWQEPGCASEQSPIRACVIFWQCTKPHTPWSTEKPHSMEPVPGTQKVWGGVLQRILVLWNYPKKLLKCKFLYSLVNKRQCKLYSMSIDTWICESRKICSNVFQKVMVNKEKQNLSQGNRWLAKNKTRLLFCCKAYVL